MEPRTTEQELSWSDHGEQVSCRQCGNYWDWYSELQHFCSMSNNNNNSNDDNKNSISHCGMHEYWNTVLLAITLPPWEESYGTPPHHMETCRFVLMPFVLMQVSWLTICSLLKSQELKVIWIKRFSSLQRATQASATYQPFWQQLFCSPFYMQFHCSKLRRSTIFPEPGVPNFQGNRYSQSMLPAPQIQENNFIVLKSLSLSSQSMKIFWLSKSPVYRS